MLDTHISQKNFDGKNFTKGQSLKLDEGLEAIIVLSVKDQKLKELLYNKILDVLIDRISLKSVYKDFSHALESINSFLSAWRQESDPIKGMSACIGIYAKKTFYFSTIGKSSCYLFNSRKQILEITEKGENPKDFNFISSGDVVDGETLLVSNYRLLDTLSQDDMKDVFIHATSKKELHAVLEQILEREGMSKNLIMTSFGKKSIFDEKTVHPAVEKSKYYFYKMLDNHFAKTCLSRVYQGLDYVKGKGKKSQQVFIALSIILLTYVLFSLVSGFLNVTSYTSNIEEAKQRLLEANQFVVNAGENMNDIDTFEYNIQQAKSILESLGNEEIFVGDIEKIQGDISLLQKKINGIEVFSSSEENTLYKGDELSPVAVVNLLGKSYIVTQNAVYGPIFGNETVEKFIFSELAIEDEFIAASVSENAIVIVTKTGKLVKFSRSGSFEYVNVLHQETWSKSPIIDSYGRNIYLLSDKENQILMHRKNGKNYDQSIAYLKDEDAISTGKILDIAIDGGIYILKMDGTMLKLFRSPKYRLESLVLNKLPANYIFGSFTDKTSPKIYADGSQRYVYMLLDNKVFVFKPNSKRFQDVKSLDYVGQIEGGNIKIQQIFIKNDGEIYVADSKGLYKMTFEIDEDSGIIIK